MSNARRSGSFGEVFRAVVDAQERQAVRWGGGAGVPAVAGGQDAIDLLNAVKDVLHVAGPVLGT